MIKAFFVLGYVAVLAALGGSFLDNASTAVRTHNYNTVHSVQ